MSHRLPPRLTIDDLGLPHWIDARRSKSLGGRYGWTDFDLFCDIDMPIVYMAKVFCVSDKTIKDWRRRRLDIKP